MIVPAVIRHIVSSDLCLPPAGGSDLNGSVSLMETELSGEEGRAVWAELRPPKAQGEWRGRPLTHLPRDLPLHQWASVFSLNMNLSKILICFWSRCTACRS